MRIHEIKNNRQRKRPRRGRGIGSGRGSKSGRGMKGQRSRSGGRTRRGFEGGKTTLITKTPKLRGSGYKNPRPRQKRFWAESVTLGQVDKSFAEGELVSPKTLAEHDLIRTPRGGAKIVRSGELTKKLRWRGLDISSTAKAAITESGGSIEATAKQSSEQKQSTTEKKP